MCKVKPVNLDNIPTLTRLWLHEMNRVFRDRLLEKVDINDFDTLLRKAVVNKLKLDLNEVFSKEHILFADFMDKDPENRI